MWEHVDSTVRKSSTKSPMMLVRDSQDLLKEFEQAATRRGNESNNCCASIFNRRAETQTIHTSKTTKDQWYSLTR